MEPVNPPLATSLPTLANPEVQTSLGKQPTNFLNTATGHAIVGILVTALGTIVTQLVNDPSLASDLGIGGVGVTILKYVVDLIRPGIASF